jgi:glycosyltransferase involved in cell wall biosynthesis
LAIPKVSIVIPVFNGANYLEAALNSALDQTHPNLEIIIVDDGSSDGGATARIGQTAQVRHPDKVRYIHQRNRGVAGALNAGVEAMSGDFFSWLSHDDLYLPHKVERQLAFWNTLDRRDAIVFGDWSYIDEAGAFLRDVRLPRARILRSPLAPVLDVAVNGCTLLVPAEILRRQRFDERYRYVQDYRLWFRLARHHGFVHLPEPLVRQRLHPAQDSHNPAAVVEGDALWSDILDQTSNLERVQATGSDLRFYREMAAQLASTPYRQAWSLAKTRAEEAIEKTRVSVILTEGAQAAMAASINSLLNQTHPNVEIQIPAASARLPGLDGHPNIRRAPTGQSVQQTSGAYVTFLRAGWCFPPDRIRAQLTWMMEAGATFCELGDFEDGPGFDSREALQGNAVMLHRSDWIEAADLGDALSALAVNWRAAARRLRVDLDPALMAYRSAQG